MSTYGKKGQQGPIRGHQASVYEATAPDGTVIRKRSFFVHTDDAFMGVFKDSTGTYVASGVTDGPKDWGAQEFVKATKIS